jgi:murein DD-endopeptidase MepM/ murein hydrolase activator NlpD
VALAIVSLTAGASSATPGSAAGAVGASPSPVSASPSSCPGSTPVPVIPSLLPTPTSCGVLLPPTPAAINPQSTGATAAPTASPSAAGTGAASGMGATGAELASLQPSGLFQLLGLLGTPASVGVETPALEHFGNAPLTTELTAHRVPLALASGARGPHPSLPPLLWAAMLLGVLGAAVVSVAGGRAGRVRLARAAAIAAAPFLLVGLVGAAPAAPTHTTAAALHSRFAAPLRQVADVASRPPASTVSQVAPTAGSGLLARVQVYETQVAHDEAQIQALAVLAAAAPTTGSAAVVAAPRGPFDGVLDPSSAAHQVALSLETDLQAEYDFFASAAHDPAQVQALLQAAALEPEGARQALAYDVQAVSAQLAQEAAIAQAAHAAPANSPRVPVTAAPTRLEAPLGGPITQGFGPSPLAFEPTLTFDGVTYPHFHTGIDIAAPLDTPVQAAANGVVALAGADTDSQGHLVGYGNYIVIAHGGGMVTLYGHLDQLLVHVGQVVRAGEVIGREGSTGNSTGPHLHFEVRIGGLLANPKNFLAGEVKPR